MNHRPENKSNPVSQAGDKVRIIINSYGPRSQINGAIGVINVLLEGIVQVCFDQKIWIQNKEYSFFIDQEWFPLNEIEPLP